MTTPRPSRLFLDPRISRRAMLRRASNGFGAMALGALLGGPAALAGSVPATRPRASMFRPRARSVIFLFMEGAVSQVDTFDHKPLLAKHHGEDPRKAIGRLEKTQFENVGTVMKSPWEFRQHGRSGTWVSSLFPNVARHVDDLCVIRSMTSNFPEHTSANYFLHSGTGLQGRPSLGAWVRRRNTRSKACGSRCGRAFFQRWQTVHRPGCSPPWWWVTSAPSIALIGTSTVPLAWPT